MGRSNKSVRITDNGRAVFPGADPGWAPWLTCPPRPTPGAKAPRATRAWSPTQKRSKHLPALRLPGQRHRCPTWLLAPLGRACSAPWPDRTRADPHCCPAPGSCGRSALELVPGVWAPREVRGPHTARPGAPAALRPRRPRTLRVAPSAASVRPRRLCSALSALHLGTRHSGESGYLPVVERPWRAPPSFGALSPLARGLAQPLRVRPISGWQERLALRRRAQVRGHPGCGGGNAAWHRRGGRRRKLEPLWIKV